MTSVPARSASPSPHPELSSSRGGPSSTRAPIWLTVSDLLEGFGRPVANAIVAATVIVFTGALAANQAIGARASISGMRARFWRVVAAQLLATIGVLLIAFTIIGLSTGAIYAVAASGLVVTYTTSGIFNFAHGAIGMLAGVAGVVAAVLVVAFFLPSPGWVRSRSHVPWSHSSQPSPTRKRSNPVCSN